MVEKYITLPTDLQATLMKPLTLRRICTLRVRRGLGNYTPGSPDGWFWSITRDALASCNDSLAAL